MKKITITVELNPVVHQLLSTLDDERDVESVIGKLIDHAQQGVYRPGSWERAWLRQAFSGDFIHRLVPGDPYGRNGCEGCFQRPKLLKDE